MRREGSTVYVSDEDAATLRDIATERGLDVATARRLLELSDEPGDDELLRPRVAAIFRLILSPASGCLS